MSHPADSDPAAAGSLRADDGSVLTPDVKAEDLKSTERAEPADSAEPEADIGHLATALGESADLRTMALVGLLVLAAVYTLRFARALLVPIVLAILLDFLFSPVVRALKRVRIPEPVGAALIMLTLIGVVGAASYRLAAPAAGWLQRGPTAMAEVEAKLGRIKAPVEQVSKAAEQVQDATQLGDDGDTPQVQVAGPSLTTQIFGGTTAMLSAAMVVVFLTYFLLAAGDLFMQKLIRVLPQFRDKKRAVKIAREVEAQISVFMVVNTLISIGVGVATGIVVKLVGLPNPVLWAIVAGLLNYVPYIGAVVTMGLLAVAGFVTFDSVERALLLPAIFFVINVFEGNLITPMLMGRRLRLNTVAVFVGLTFWWYIWGIPGAIMAVPMLAALKIVSDHFESLKPVGEFLGE